MKSLTTYEQGASAGYRISQLSGLFWLVLVLSAAGVRAQKPLDPREVLEQLNNAAVDPTQIYVLRNAQITRDRMKMFFNRGFVGFLTKAAGEITGAVFTGEGEILLIPPNPVEKRNLAQFTQSPILEEQFVSAYMRFTDQTAQDLLAAARRPDPDDPEQPTDFVEQWDSVVHNLSPDYSLRILRDLLGDRNFPFFHTRIQAVNLPVFEVNVDERSVEAVSMGIARRTGERVYVDLWCSFPSKASERRMSSLLAGPARVHSYKIDTRIHADHSLEGRAELEMESRSGSERVLVFELSRWLKVSEVRDERGESLVVFQNPSLEESEAATRGNDWVDVILPSPRPVGEKFRLSFAYQGNVIADVGNGVLYVGARGSWYPNLGLSAPASYDLTFHCPEELTLVATGTQVEETSSAGLTHSRWHSDGVFRVAGFNLGTYDSHTRRAGNTTVEVYAAGGAEASLEKRHAAARQPDHVVARPLGPVQRAGPLEIVTKPIEPLAPSALMEKVAESAARSIEYFETLFGPFPYPRLAIAQIPGSFGQGWPELVYLPTLSFLSKAERSEIGLTGKSEDLISQTMIPHEVAHQWWGNLLGWKTYRDQWLSEALATYAAALFLSQEKDGERKFRDLLRGYKRDLLARTKGGATVESDGPIWLGQRLSNSLDPAGYDNIVYKKACWVLHMLRGLMTDPASGSDQKFFNMLRDFVVAHRGENLSTEDFIRHAEKYMTRSSDLEHNRRLDWFFKEWVYDTGIPTYTLEASTRRLAPNKFLIQGSVEQSGVPSEFEMLVPVVAVYGKDKKVTLGRIAVGEAGGRFRFTATSRPSRITIDEENLLAVVR
jgi:hypothetical protein